MKVSKSKIFAGLAWAVVLAIYIFLVFMLSEPRDRKDSFWLGFSFTMFAFVVTLVPVLIGIKAKSALTSYPVFGLCAAYFAIQFIVGLIFIIFKWKNVTFVVIIEVLLLLIFAGLLFFLLSANSAVNKQEQVIVQKRRVLSELQERLAYINHKVTDSAVKAEIAKLSEKIRFSDPMANAATANIDAEISNGINALGLSVAEGDNESLLSQLSDLSFLVTQRNTILKNNK